MASALARRWYPVFATLTSAAGCDGRGRSVGAGYYPCLQDTNSRSDWALSASTLGAANAGQ